ncbi:MAG TPA: SRPBCC domain-containing protein [Tepidisphaeraceae bacterium]|jgi:uncharacterized protein YndB with AHSA1/START domain|nr:SRPBCC domain-containing protein [Tepidisphaeraceae bacterium]
MAKKTSSANFDVAKIKLEIPIAAPPKKVWRALTRDTDKWWPKTFCMNPKRAVAFRMEFRLGGRMYEDWGNGNGWLWWTIHKIDSENFTFSTSGYEGSAAITTAHFQVLPKGTSSILQISDETFGAADYIKSVTASHMAGWKELFEGAFKPYAQRSKTK